MFLAWFVGVSGMSNGYTTVSALRSGPIPDVQQVILEAKGADDPMDGLAEVLVAARLEAANEVRKTAFPLAVARLVLGALLIVMCAMAISGRPSARNFALQAIAASALFAIADYVLSAPIRELWVARVALAVHELPLDAPEHQMLRVPEFFSWIEGVRLVVLQLGSLGCAALALFARSTRAFFEVVANDHDEHDGEEEP